MTGHQRACVYKYPDKPDIAWNARLVSYIPALVEVKVLAGTSNHLISSHLFPSLLAVEAVIPQDSDGPSAVHHRHINNLLYALKTLSSF